MGTRNRNLVLTDKNSIFFDLPPFWIYSENRIRGECRGTLDPLGAHFSPRLGEVGDFDFRNAAHDGAWLYSVMSLHRGVISSQPRRHPEGPRFRQRPEGSRVQ